MRYVLSLGPFIRWGFTSQLREELKAKEASDYKHA